MRHFWIGLVCLALAASGAEATLYLGENFNHQDVLGNGWDNVSGWSESHQEYPANPNGPEGNVGCVVPWQDEWRLGKALDLTDPLSDVLVVEWTAWQHAGTERAHVISLVDDTGTGVSFEFRMRLRDTVPEEERFLQGGVGTTADNGATYTEIDAFKTMTGSTYAYDETVVNKFVWNRTSGQVQYLRDETTIGTSNVGTMPDPSYLVIWGNCGWDQNQGIDDLIVIPDPATLGLLGLGGLALIARRRR